MGGPTRHLNMIREQLTRKPIKLHLTLSQSYREAYQVAGGYCHNPNQTSNNLYPITLAVA